MAKNKTPATPQKQGLAGFAENLEVRNLMTVRLMSFKEGFTEYTGVKVIRITGKTNLLIMCDYLPVLGEIDGTLEFITADDVFKFENINGYYTHSNNVFTYLDDEETVC